MDNSYDVTVIGAGPAGISAAIWCKRLGLNVIIVEQSEKIGGQLQQIHNDIIDYPGLISSNGDELIKSFETHLHSLNIPIHLNEKVLNISRSKKEIVSERRSWFTKFVIFATGSGPRKLNIPGEKELYERNNNHSTSKDIGCFKGKTVAIIGGGDHAFEGALNIADVAEHVFLIHRSSTFKARKSFVEQAMSHTNITIKKNCQVTKVNHENDAVKSINIIGKENVALAVDVVLIRIGVSPNSNIIPIESNDNVGSYIDIDKNLRTSVPWIFATGDIVTPPALSSISTAVSQGMIAAKTISLEV
jgi:thioredoxin reductase (NADPH)